MPTVLIADDEKNIRSTLARSFKIEGYATMEARDGSEALEMVAGGEVDLVILDLQMPILECAQRLGQGRIGPEVGQQQCALRAFGALLQPEASQ